MDCLGPCPRCGRTDGGYYRCKTPGCWHKGCFKGQFLSSDEGCWKGARCPKCGESNYEAIGYLSEK